MIVSRCGWSLPSASLSCSMRLTRRWVSRSSSACKFLALLGRKRFLVVLVALARSACCRRPCHPCRIVVLRVGRLLIALAIIFWPSFFGSPPFGPGVLFASAVFAASGFFSPLGVVFLVAGIVLVVLVGRVVRVIVLAGIVGLVVAGFVVAVLRIGGLVGVAGFLGGSGIVLAVLAIFAVFAIACEQFGFGDDLLGFGGGALELLFAGLSQRAVGGLQGLR